MIAGTGKSRSCFLHVPKSGGTALTLHLRNVLGRQRVFHIGEGRYRNAPLEGLMKRYSIITGHFNLGQVPERLFDTTFFFTFLREPVDRIVSMYHFFKEGDLDSDHRVRINEEWSLAGALDKWVRPGECTAWSNEQTFLFSGAPDPDQPPETLLPLALRNLERFDFVGIHERFAEGVGCLGRLRGWPLDAPVPRFKTSRKRLTVAEVEPALVERIIAANACDIQLYARARELWESARARAASIPGVEISPPAVDSPAETLLPRVEKGTREISFNNIDAFDLRTGGDAVVQQGNPLEIRLGVYSTIDTDDIHLRLRLCDEADMDVYGTGTRLQGRSLSLEGGAITPVTFVFDMSLAVGGYFLSVVVEGGDTHDGKLFHAVDNALLIWCEDAREPSFVGVVDLRARLKVGNPVFTEKGRWRPPAFVRRAIRAVRAKFTPLPRPPKLVRYVLRTVKYERWNAIRVLLRGKPSPKPRE